MSYYLYMHKFFTIYLKLMTVAELQQPVM